MTATDSKPVRHLTPVPDPVPVANRDTAAGVTYFRWAAGRVQQFAGRTVDENPLIVAQECGLLLGHPVDVTDLVDLADALEDVATAEDAREARLRQPSVDEITTRIVNGTTKCAATS